MYLFVKTETPTSEIETVAHPVESGINITDHVRKKPDEISLEGEIVGENAKDILEQIKQINQTGVVVTYVGVNYFKNGQIMNFETEHNNEIAGGCTFTMTIREVRFAQNSYDPAGGAGAAEQTTRPIKETTSVGVQQRTRNSTSDIVTHTVKNGDTDYLIAQRYRSEGATYEEVKKHLAEIKSNKEQSKIEIGNR